jgi:hypothetical protein
MMRCQHNDGETTSNSPQSTCMTKRSKKEAAVPRAAILAHIAGPAGVRRKLSACNLDVYACSKPPIVGPMHALISQIVHFCESRWGKKTNPKLGWTHSRRKRVPRVLFAAALLSLVLFAPSLQAQTTYSLQHHLRGGPNPCQNRS